MMIEEFGTRVASVWAGLRPATRNMFERALQASGATNPAQGARAQTPYDARADWELSRLLAVLDERAADSSASLSAEQTGELRRMAETCAAVLQNQAQSAEVFAQLVQRAHARQDYARIDALADALAQRFAPAEICELARASNPVVRALAQEALAQSPTNVLISLLADPVDAEIARDALACQAAEYGSEEARQIINALDQTEEEEEDW